MNELKLTFIGSGYVGLVSAAGYASLGNECTCIDISNEKVAQINNGVPPIYEEGLEELLKKLRTNDSLKATTDYSSLKGSDVVLICVGTPTRKGGAIDLSYIEKAAEQIGEVLKESGKYAVVVVKSTVVPGTTTEKVLPILEDKSGKKAGRDFGIGMMPEFLKEGTALEDFKQPDRLVIGAEDQRAFEVLRKMHSSFKCPILEVPISTAEMIKYASNSFLATRISFINQLANLCERIGINVDEVAKGMGMDRRVAPYFLKAGPGFGGSCFPKDVKALMAFSAEKGIEATLLEEVMEINYLQPFRMLEIAKQDSSLEGKKVAVMGLAFKPDTDDVRESSAITLVSELLKMNCKLSAYDPKAAENFKKIFPDIKYANTFQEALKDAEVCFIVTDWKEFKKPLTEYEKLMKYPLIIDSRRILDEKTRKTAKYFAIGRGDL